MSLTFGMAKKITKKIAEKVVERIPQFKIAGLNVEDGDRSGYYCATYLYIGDESNPTYEVDMKFFSSEEYFEDDADGMKVDNNEIILEAGSYPGKSMSIDYMDPNVYDNVIRFIEKHLPTSDD